MKTRIKFMAWIMLCGALAFTACEKKGGNDNSFLLFLLGGGTGVTVPEIPGAATVTAGVGELSLSWAPVTGATSYQLYYSKTNDSSGATPDAHGNITDTSHTITGLDKGATYYVWLRASNTAGQSGYGPVASGTPEWAAGDQTTYTADSVSFNVVYVPGKTFPTGVDDNGDIDGNGTQDVSPTATVANAYWVGETEVTYELWDTVYDWALDTTVDHDGDGYTNAIHGDDDVYTFDAVIMTAYPDRPVPNINWRDCLVWCNALTEWYNAKNGTSNYCVYYTSVGLKIRSVSNADIDAPTIYIDANASGFRLITSNEWELAARYVNDANNDGDITDAGEYYPGKHVSGDSTSYCYPTDSGTSTVFGDYAVNNQAVANDVGSRTDNALGIHDMSGNVLEWCFDLYGAGPTRVTRGGSYVGNYPEYLRLGLVSYSMPGDAVGSRGFRVARTR